MKFRWYRFWIALWILACPAGVLADFSIGEFPQYAQDQAPTWIFQILSAIFLALSQLLYGMLTGSSATAA